MNEVANVWSDEARAASAEARKASASAKTREDHRDAMLKHEDAAYKANKDGDSETAAKHSAALKGHLDVLTGKQFQGPRKETADDKRAAKMAKALHGDTMGSWNTALVANAATENTREVMEDGKKWLVAPAVIIPHGVMSGSKGPLYYPEAESKRTIAAWDRVPITVQHPFDPGTGAPLSANDAGVKDRQEIGEVRNPTHDGRSKAELWFDHDKTLAKSPDVYAALKRHEKIPLSTGLFTNNVPKRGEHAGVPYVAEALDHRPDHLAVLPDGRGACHISDGCGVNIENSLTVNAAACDCGSSCDKCRVKSLKAIAASLKAANDPEGAKEVEARISVLENAKHPGTGKFIKQKDTVGAHAEHGWDDAFDEEEVENSWSDAAREASSAARKAAGGPGARSRDADAASMKANAMSRSGDHRAAAKAHDEAAELHDAAAGKGNPDISAQSEKNRAAADKHALAADAHRSVGMTGNSWSDAAREAAIATRKANALGRQAKEHDNGRMHGMAAKAHGLASRAHDRAADAAEKEGKSESDVGKHMDASSSHEDKSDWHAQASSYARNERVTMNREQALEILTANCTCDGDRQALNSLSDGALSALAANKEFTSDEERKAAFAHMSTGDASSKADKASAHAGRVGTAEAHDKAQSAHETAAKSHKAAAKNAPDKATRAEHTAKAGEHEAAAEKHDRAGAKIAGNAFALNAKDDEDDEDDDEDDRSDNSLSPMALMATMNRMSKVEQLTRGVRDPKKRAALVANLCRRPEHYLDEQLDLMTANSFAPAYAPAGLMPMFGGPPTPAPAPGPVENDEQMPTHVIDYTANASSALVARLKQGMAS